MNKQTLPVLRQPRYAEDIDSGWLRFGFGILTNQTNTEIRTRKTHLNMTFICNTWWPDNQKNLMYPKGLCISSHRLAPCSNQLHNPLGLPEVTGKWTVAWFQAQMNPLVIAFQGNFNFLKYDEIHLLVFLLFMFRSSSQTSGFISCSAENPFSNFTSLPNSRVNSLYGDRNSVLSEPIFNTQREMVSCYWVWLNYSQLFVLYGRFTESSNHNWPIGILWYLSKIPKELWWKWFRQFQFKHWKVFTGEIMNAFSFRSYVLTHLYCRVSSLHSNPMLKVRLLRKELLKHLMSVKGNQFLFYTRSSRFAYRSIQPFSFLVCLSTS